MEMIVKRFYDSLDEGKLMGRKCTDCGAVEFPPVIMCNACSCTSMEWLEVSGEAEMFDCILPSALSAKPNLAPFMPYSYACVRLKEGAELNAVVCGVSRKNKKEIRENMPIPVKAKIVQMEGYKTVIFEKEAN